MGLDALLHSDDSSVKILLGYGAEERTMSEVQLAEKVDELKRQIKLLAEENGQLRYEHMRRLRRTRRRLIGAVNGARIVLQRGPAEYQRAILGRHGVDNRKCTRVAFVTREGER